MDRSSPIRSRPPRLGGRTAPARRRACRADAAGCRAVDRPGPARPGARRPLDGTRNDCRPGRSSRGGRRRSTALRTPHLEAADGRRRRFVRACAPAPAASARLARSARRASRRRRARRRRAPPPPHRSGHVEACRREPRPAALHRSGDAPKQKPRSARDGQTRRPGWTAGRARRRRRSRRRCAAAPRGGFAPSDRRR